MDNKENFQMLPEMNFILQTLSKHKRLLVVIVNLLFVSSGTVLAVATITRQIGLIVFATGGLKGRLVLPLMLLTFAGLVIFAFKFHFLEKTLNKLRENTILVQVLFVVFAMLCAGLFVGNFYENAYIHAENLQNQPYWWYHLIYAYGKAATPLPYTLPQWLFSTAIFFPVFIFYLYLFLSFADVIKNLVIVLTKAEKRVLFYVSLGSVFLIIVLYNLSNVYWAPVLRGTEDIFYGI
jgi:hypothetical protein